MSLLFYFILLSLHCTSLPLSVADDLDFHRVLAQSLSPDTHCRTYCMFY